MNEVEIISKESLAKARGENKTLPNRTQMAHIVTPGIKLAGKTSENYAAMEGAKAIANEGLIPTRASMDKFGSPWDVPVICQTLKKENPKASAKMSVREMMHKGVFASGNTLPEDWQTLWDALRIDISIRMSGIGTVRENFYNMRNMFESDKIYNVTEFYPYNIVFEEHNGEGEAVNQGESRGGANETVENFLYAAGFTWTLLASLFRNSIDPEKIADAVTVAYDAKRDNLSMSPILDFSYSGTQQTAADTTGSNRQEKLYNTIDNAIDDFSKRKDPITNREIPAAELVLLASAQDARHAQRVMNGLPSVNELILPSITGVSSIVSYEGETITGRVKNTVYPGVTPGIAYLVKKNRYMHVGIKRNLTLEVDLQPNVATLAQEQRAWYFAESQQTTGIQYYVQEITLPAW